MVQRTLQRLDGVVKTEVDFDQKKADLTLDGEFRLSPDAIEQALKRLGFQRGEIQVLGSGRIVSQDGVLWIRFENHPDVALERTPLADQLSGSPATRLWFQVVGEADESLRLKILRPETQP